MKKNRIPISDIPLTGNITAEELMKTINAEELRKNRQARIAFGIIWMIVIFSFILFVSGLFADLYKKGLWADE